MDLRYTAPEQAFRAELRTWLAATLPGVGAPPPHDDWPARRAYDLRWQRLLFEAGYAGVDWPAEGGGRGSSPVEQLIFKEECERAGAPYVGVNFVGLLHAGPDHHRRGHGGPEGALPAGHPARARRCGARASASPTPAATWPRCAPGPCATATTTW